MKFKAQYELAKQSLRSKKKNTRRTIFGLAFGMILILPLIMVMLGLNFGMSNQFEENANYINYTLDVMDYRQDLDDVGMIYEGNGSSIPGKISGSRHLQEFIAYDEKNICTVFEQYGYTVKDFNFLQVDGQVIAGQSDGRYYNVYFNVVDMDMCDTFFPASSLKKGVPLYEKGYDAGFEKDTKRQVVVTQRFLDKHNLTAQAVYGKNISLNYNALEGYYFCKDYKVVGILSNAFLSIHDSSDLFYAADFYFLSYDMYDQNGKRIIDSDSASLIQSNPYALNNNNAGGKDVDGVPYTYLRFESSNMMSLIRLYDYIHEEYQKLSPTFQETQLFRSFYYIYDVVHQITGVFLGVAVFVIIIILLNLFITVYHNVDYKSQYLAMLESMGMQEKDLIRTYLTESFIVATKANIVISVLSLIFGIVIRIMGGQMLNQVVSLGFTLVPVWAMIVALIMGIVFVYATTLLIAYGCVKGFTKKNITEVLNSKEQNG